MTLALVALCHAALVQPFEQLTRRQVVTSHAAAALALAPHAATAQPRKYFETTKGIKYFDLDEGSCSVLNFNACTLEPGGVRAMHTMHIYR